MAANLWILNQQEYSLHSFISSDDWKLKDTLVLAVGQQGSLMERVPKRPKTKVWLKTG